MIVLMSAAIYFVYVPLAKRHATDFAAEIVSAAHLLQDLPESMHDEIRRELLLDHGLIVAEDEDTSPESAVTTSAIPFFRKALTEQAGEELTIYDSGAGPFTWVNVPAHGKMYRIGFDRNRLGTNPPVALLLVLAGGALLTLLASIAEVRRVVRPLDQLSGAVQKLASGLNPAPLPEEGPAEIVSVARAFNQLMSDLKQMADNRTVMIAGISHDLRTPLTRMAIAIEMLDCEPNAKLVERLRRDIDRMNDLIGQFLQFSQGVEDECPAQLDLWRVLEGIAHDLHRDGTEVRLRRNDPPCVYYADPVALERVLTNLLKNAVSYGKGRPVDVELNCTAEKVSIEILDRGPGIPEEAIEAVFRPFHRLETARNAVTGGTGLGLAIAHQLSVKHGWAIELLPREGGGTIARLDLPIANRFGLNVSACAA